MNLQFRKSSFCTLRECVEVARVAVGVAMRHSRRADDGPVLVFGRRDWATFVQVIKAGGLDSSLMTSPFRVVSLTPHILLFGCIHQGRRSILIQDTRAPQRRLVITPAEWDAFLAGVRVDEFDFDMPMHV